MPTPRPLLSQLEADELASRDDGLADDTSTAATAGTQPDESNEAPAAAAASTPDADSAGTTQEAAAPSGMTQAEETMSADGTDLQHPSAPEGDGADPSGHTTSRQAPAEAAQPEPPGQSQQPDAGVVPPPADRSPPIVLHTEPATESVPEEPATMSPAAAAEAVPDTQDLRDEEPADATPEEQSGGACKQS